eukprot:2021137-Rhodomonas_salina.1
MPSLYVGVFDCIGMGGGARGDCKSARDLADRLVAAGTESPATASNPNRAKWASSTSFYSTLSTDVCRSITPKTALWYYAQPGPDASDYPVGYPARNSYANPALELLEALPKAASLPFSLWYKWINANRDARRTPSYANETHGTQPDTGVLFVLDIKCTFVFSNSLLGA